MEFIQENYLWFIIGGIVILMAVIGYIADKTNFGRNKIEKAPKEPKQPKETKPEKIEIDAKGIGELTQNLAEENNDETTKVVEPSVIEETGEEQPVVEPAEIPVEETPTENNEDVSFTLSTDDASLYEPLPGSATTINSPIADDLTTPVEPVVEPFAVPASETINEPEDLTAPLTEVVNEETGEEQPVVIDNSEVASDDDIWKF